MIALKGPAALPRTAKLPARVAESSEQPAGEMKSMRLARIKEVARRSAQVASATTDATETGVTQPVATPAAKPRVRKPRAAKPSAAKAAPAQTPAVDLPPAEVVRPEPPTTTTEQPFAVAETQELVTMPETSVADAADVTVVDSPAIAFEPPLAEPAPTVDLAPTVELAAVELTPTVDLAPAVELAPPIDVVPPAESQPPRASDEPEHEVATTDIIDSAPVAAMTAIAAAPTPSVAEASPARIEPAPAAVDLPTTAWWENDPTAVTPPGSARSRPSLIARVLAKVLRWARLWR